VFSLTIDDNTSGSVSTILHAFRQNGSLGKITMRGDSKVWSIEKQMLDAYGRRNRLVPQILSNLETDDSMLHVVPILFRLAQHARRMAPNCILLGLLASKKIKVARLNALMHERSLETIPRTVV
jgi:hypothetical protein